MTYKFPSAIIGDEKSGRNFRQPFVATCSKCKQTIYFDIDERGTPGFNGDWGDGAGDYGCEIDNGEDSEDGNGHVPSNIRYNLHLYPYPKDCFVKLRKVGKKRFQFLASSKGKISNLKVHALRFAHHDAQRTIHKMKQDNPEYEFKIARV